MGRLIGFRCIDCGQEQDGGDFIKVCPGCSGNLEVVLDLTSLRKNGWSAAIDERASGLWRYLPLLPLPEDYPLPEIKAGGTPLYRNHFLAERLGIAELFFKDETRNPSGSFKDRASAVVLAHAQLRGEGVVCAASTGNAAASLACLAAGGTIVPVIFVPRTAPQAKIAQLLVYGAKVFTVDGNYDQAFELSIAASKRHGWYNRNTGYNPFTREGKKTCSFEMAEQLRWQVPDQIFVPVGDGNIISGISKGWRELKECGLIDRIPRLVAIQAEQSNAISEAWKSGGAIVPVSGNTLADSISVSLPRDGNAAVRAIRESDGYALTVSDGQILEAIPELARSTGIFAEPAAAAGFAGLKVACQGGKIGCAERVVVLVTGNGLKDVASAMRSVGEPISVAANLDRLPDLGLTRR